MRFFMLTTLLLVAAINVTIACECGMEGSSGRIYKGTKVRANKYPWLAHIRSFADRDDNSFGQCGGSLIDETHVATAAHCVVTKDGQRYKPENIDVFLGRVKAFSDFSYPHKVSKVWFDPKYDSSNLSNDFAILTLSKPVKFTQTIAPVCLPNNESDLTKLTVSGWGLTSANAKSSDDLLEVEVDFMDKEECNDAKKTIIMKQNDIPIELAPLIRTEPVAESHMCAINKKTRGDACSGDSGGPLMHHGDNGRWYLMGVVSGSWTECGQDKDTSGLYTRTLYYQDVIKSIAPNACWQDL
ncbi:serine protease 48-like [Tetranychus urticae]|uniref:Peptidase S1 domain-containing protein n=1 Tax=Tetranychus urticae TaxID=32264 RepID=T1KJ67_TETUR|nr:serine protease 48-like [Tetranychus urticae]